MNVTPALLEAADELAATRWPSLVQKRLLALLKLHTHFANSALASVLEAKGDDWALHALLTHPDGDACHCAAAELLRVLAAQPAGAAALRRPTVLPAASIRCQHGLSAELLASRAAAEAASPAGCTVVAVHCGGPGASKKARIAALNADTAFLERLQRCVSGADSLASLCLRPVPSSDPRRPLAGVGTAVHALAALPAFTPLACYAGWVTTEDAFAAAVCVAERATAEAFAVTTRRSVVVAGEALKVMVVAHPPCVANLTRELNDWRAEPGGGREAGACNCALVELLEWGWPHLVVVTLRDVPAGAELTVQYPSGFWVGRPAAVAAQAVVVAALRARKRGREQ